MFRRFSLFDSSPPASRISINPPRANKSDRKSSLKGAIINTLQLDSSPPSILINSHDAKRSKSLDHSSNLRLIQSQSVSKQRAKSATLPPIINRHLPQSSPTSHRWYNRLGNSFRRGTWRKPPIQYQVISQSCVSVISQSATLKSKHSSFEWNPYRLVFVLLTTGS